MHTAPIHPEFILAIDAHRTRSAPPGEDVQTAPNLPEFEWGGGEWTTRRVAA